MKRHEPGRMVLGLGLILLAAGGMGWGPKHSLTPAALAARPAKSLSLAARITARAPGGAPAIRAQAGPHPVQIVNFDYAPNQLTVDVGTSLTWTNTADRPHTVTDRGGTFDSQPILPQHTSSVTFTVPGTYFYFCRINPSRMNGLVVVRASPQAGSVTRIQAVDPGNIAGEQFRFDPPTPTATVGSVLLVANVGGKPHTVTADDGSFTTGVITPGPEGGRFPGSFALVTLPGPGTYPFHCEIHPQLMRGVITITGQAPASPPPQASTAARQASVTVVNFAFQPAQATVAPGGQVSFHNAGTLRHTATFDDVGLDTAVVAPGSTGQLTAPLKPGSYSYHCSIHPAKMRGVLVVLGQNTPDPTAATAATAGKTALAGSTPGGRVSVFVLVTGVLGAFAGGLGIAPFLRRRAAPREQ